MWVSDADSIFSAERLSDFFKETKLESPGTWSRLSDHGVCLFHPSQFELATLPFSHHLI